MKKRRMVKPENFDNWSEQQKRDWVQKELAKAEWNAKQLRLVSNQLVYSRKRVEDLLEFDRPDLDLMKFEDVVNDTVGPFTE